jgi:mannose-6-phosphate isomerase-like protein (cupin superfamily)
MDAERATPVVRRQVPAHALAPGVTVAELLDDRQGCRGLHQRRLRLAGGAEMAGTAGGRGEAWYVIGGSGTLTAGTAAAGPAAGAAALRPGTAVWLGAGQGYRCRAAADPGHLEGSGDFGGSGDLGGPGDEPGLQILASTVRTGSPADQVFQARSLEVCEPERSGDREFRVLLSSGLTITQFAGLIPPGRAPEHQHAYDEVVHVLAGRGVLHLRSGDTPIEPGTAIYLPPQAPHCLENTGQDPLRVLGVFHPAGSPAAKRDS